jgi:hypothetical protein
MGSKKRDEWAHHLTPDLSEHFEFVGEDAVRFDVFQHRYKEPEKHMAALVWLYDKRRKRELRDNATFWLVAIGVVLTAFSVGLAIG